MNLPNYKFDGNFANSHFGSRRFNKAVSNVIIKELKRIRKNYQGELAIYDLGAGTGDLLIALEKELLLKELTKNVKLIGIEVDKNKFTAFTSKGKPPKSIINYQQQDLNLFAPQLTKPVLFFERAVLQYFTGKSDLKIKSGYSPNQKKIYQKYLKLMPSGSSFVEILSTGQDKTGLLRFEYLLNRISGGKSYNLLTCDEYQHLVMDVSSKAKAFEVKTCVPLSGKYGFRNSLDMFYRYGEKFDTDYPGFKDWLYQQYLEAVKLFPGQTKMFKIHKGTKVIDILIDYQINILQVN